MAMKLKTSHDNYQAQNSGDCGVNSIAKMSEYCFAEKIWNQSQTKKLSKVKKSFLFSKIAVYIYLRKQK